MIGLGLGLSLGGVPAAAEEPEPEGLDWVVFSGTESLRRSTQAFGSDTATATMAIALRNVTTGASGRLHDLSGRGNVLIATDGDLRIGARNTSNTLLFQWDSQGQIDVDAAGNHSLVIRYLGDGLGIEVTWDGDIITGEYSTSPIAGAIDWTRTEGNGIGSAHNAGSDFLIGELAQFYLKTGTLVDVSNFYADGEPVVYTGDTPEINFYGPAADWQSGVNKGSTASTWTVAGTITDA